MKKILITGGLGFIGSHIVDIFKDKDYEVFALDHFSVKAKRYPTVKYLQVDLKDKNKVFSIIKNIKPHIISHHASGLVGVNESIANPQKAFEDIIIATNIFEAVKNNGIEHIIFASSANIYSNSVKPPITEESKIEPLSPYGITKYGIELYCEYLHRAFGVDFTIFRYFNIYGPRQRLRKDAGIVPILINGGLNEESVTIFGDGLQTRDFTFVEDIAMANYVAAKKKIHGVFNVGNGVGTSIRDLVHIVEEILDKKIAIIYVNEYSGIYKSLSDIKKITNLLGWSPKTKLFDGLKKTIEYYRKYEKDNNQRR